MKRNSSISVIAIMILASLLLPCTGAQVNVLDDFEKHGIWKVDRDRHRCLVDPGVWARWPFETKEQCLWAIYQETKTWWEVYDYYSGKLLGKVGSWGWKVYP